MADVWYKTGQFSTPASGTTVIDVTDKGTAPKGIHLWWSKVTADDTVTANQFFGHGFSDGTTHRAFMTNAQDGANNNRRDNENTGAILIDNVTDTRTVVGGAVTMNTNDVTIAYSVFAANHIIHYEIWGGADCAAELDEMAANTSPDTTSTFTSDLILVACTGNAIENASQHAFMCFGAAHDNGASIDQWCQFTYMGDNDTDVVGSALSTALIAGQYNSDYTNWTATVTAIGATGFTWTGSNADEWAALKLNLGGVGVDVGTFAKATGAAPATQAMPDLGFTPMGYALASCDYTSTTIPADETNRLVHASFGAYDGATQTSALAVGTASSNADRASQSHSTEVLQGSSALQASGVEWSGTAQAITDATPDIEWNPNTANAVIIGYYAFEDTNLGGAITNRTLTDNAVVSDPADFLRLRDRETLSDFAVDDALVSLRLRLREAADSITAADSDVSFKLADREIADSLAAVDNAIELRKRDRMQSDSSVVVDFNIELRLRIRELLDNLIVMTDSITGSKIKPRLFLDSIATGDDHFELRERFRELLSAISVGDSTIGLRQRFRELVDDVAVTDTVVSVRISAIFRTLLDSIELIDNHIELRNRFWTLLDSIELIDNHIELRNRNRELFDSIVVIDNAIGVRISAIFRTLLDAIEATDSITPLRFRDRLSSDEATVQDVSITSRERNRLSQNTLLAADSIATLVDKPRLLVDTLDVEAGFIGLLKRARILTDNPAITDSVIATYIREGGALNDILLMDQFDVFDFVTALKIQQLVKRNFQHGIEKLDIDHSVDRLNILTKITRET